MKLHYGYLVTGAMIFFMGFIGYIVYGSLSQNIDLVAENYYEKEINFQHNIESETNANALSEKVTLQKSKTTVTIKLPSIFIDKPIKGNINFKRSSDKTKDVLLDFSTAKIDLPLDQFQPGPYHLEVYWEGNGKTYLFKDYIVF